MTDRNTSVSPVSTVVHTPVAFTPPGPWPAEHFGRYLADQLAFGAGQVLDGRGTVGAPTHDSITAEYRRGECAVCGGRGCPTCNWNGTAR